MNRSVLWLAAAMLPLVFASGAHAQATRTWVSGVGDDANPCSRTAPCKTFAGAISKTAAGGEIDALDPGGYGAVTITKSITIDGGGGQVVSVLVAGTNGIVISAGATDTVVLRNLSLQGLNAGLDGIKFLAGGALHVENVAVSGFTGQGLNFVPGGASQLFITGSTFRKNAAGGVMIQPTVSGTAVATLDGVSLNGNGRGLRAEDGSIIVVRNSTATGNGANGFVAYSTSGTPRPISMAIENTTASANGAAGIYAGPMANVRISNVTVTNNSDGLIANGGVITSFGNNHVDGNAAHNGPANSVVPPV